MAGLTSLRSKPSSTETQQKLGKPGAHLSRIQASCHAVGNAKCEGSHSQMRYDSEERPRIWAWIGVQRDRRGGWRDLSRGGKTPRPFDRRGTCGAGPLVGSNIRPSSERKDKQAGDPDIVPRKHQRPGSNLTWFFICTPIAQKLPHGRKLSENRCSHPNLNS